MDSSKSLSHDSSAETRSTSSLLEISAELKDAVHYLSELVGSYDAETLCRACQYLADTIKKADNDCLQLLLERDVVSIVTKMMAELPSHSLAQQAGCDAILSCNETVELRASLEKHSAFRQILMAMKSHPKDTELLKKALHALASLVVTAVDEVPLKESQAFGYVLLALRNHGDDVDIQAGGFLALASLLEIDSYAASSIALQGDFDFILAAVKKHFAHPGVVVHGFLSLRVIVRSTVSSRKMYEIKKHLDYIVEVLFHYANHEDIATAALGLLEAVYSLELNVLLESESSYKQQLKCSDVLQLITELLERYTELSDAQLYGFNCLFHLFTLFKFNVSDEFLDRCLKLLNIAMIYHSESMEINESCCQFLSQLLTCYRGHNSIIGDKKDQIPLHSHVWMILLNLSCKPDSMLFIAACSALHSLIEWDGPTNTLQQLLLRKGAATALLECLRGYIGEMENCEKCIECGCQALRSILMHHCSNEQKQYLLDVGIFAVLQSIMDGFIHVAGVITETFCVIACLSDISTFQDNVIEHSLYKGILECVERHISEEVLVEVALEIFIILSLNTDMIQCLNDVDTLGVTVSIMRKHVIYSSVQFKGCILIRLLCDPKYLVSVSDSLSTAIANVVVDALARKMDIKVQSEALACGQVLSKCSYQMAKALVKGDVHILLFTLLYRETSDEEKTETEVNETAPQNANVNDTDQYFPPFDDDNKVKEFFFHVGTDIIFTLSYYWDFKQEMLTTTIIDELLEGVNILVDIGADVNFGEGKDTPICLAVQTKNNKMVECLLEYNITNVNVREALKLSWDLKLDSVTGLLLEHIAVDRSRESVNLSGLELATLKPLWILPSLGVKTLPKVRRGHKKQRSLGHVKEFLNIRRKSVATDRPFEMEVSASLIADNSKRRMSVVSSLKYMSDTEVTDDTEEVDYVSSSMMDIEESSIILTNVVSEISPSLDPLADAVSSHYTEDSGVDTAITVHRQPSSESGLSESLSEVFLGVKSRGTVRRQRHGTVSGATNLPHCTLEQYTVEKEEDVSALSSVSSDMDSTFSPAQLIRKYRRCHNKSGRQLLSESLTSSVSFQADSPIPIMYHANPLDGLQENRSDYYNTNGSGLPLSPSNEVLNITSTSIPARDEVDFSSYNPIPEELSFTEQPNTHLIKMLDLSSNKLCNFNDMYYGEHGGDFLFKRLRDVSKLDLKQNRLSELVRHMMKEMGRLVRIDLSCNSFSTFPVEAMLSARLTEVDLSANQISEVPSFPLMPNLMRFNLSNNLLTAMPGCVFKLTGQSSFPHLKYFNLRGNQIVTVPKCDAHFCDLEVLNISHNKIEELPDEFLVSMPSLRMLDASTNEISSIGGGVGQDMVHLEELKLAVNSLSSDEAYLNMFITSLPVLQSLDVSENGLTLIPPPHAWKSLGVREIKYTANRLSKVDLSEGKRFWSHLESLYIGQNKLKDIPKEIGQLRCLTCLDISQNKDIRHLPGELGDLDHLFVLNLEGLKNLSLDSNLLNGPVKGIIGYLKSRP